MDVLSIGILAHNEAAIIDRTIASLLGQSILDSACATALGVDTIEVVVVPNGCSDDTATVAKVALAVSPPHIAVSVQDLPEPGKSNAWNRFVHDLARPDATLLALMDADIVFGGSDVIERLVRRLIERPQAEVSTDRALKDYRGRRLTPLDLFSRRVSKQQEGNGGLCGQLYCARAAVLRQIWLPLTAGFTRQPDSSAISYVSDASHFYEPLAGVAAFIRHEARIVVGSVINAWLFTLLWDAGKRGHVGELIHRRNVENPYWVEEVCAQAKAERGRWLVPRAFILWRLASLDNQSWRRKVLRAPVALAATLATLPAVMRANAILRRPAARLHW